MRCCWIGTHIGREAGLPEEQLWELYYTLLLKDLGCTGVRPQILEIAQNWGLTPV
jgi:HD-GYP domain-containing protein (c-di-GMP phosphodiesterase class II)